MANARPFRAGPLALTTSAANILNPPAVSGGVNGGSPALAYRIRHIHVVNRTGTAATFSLYIGATAGSASGTEVAGSGRSVPANGVIDVYYPNLRLVAADFLTGLASANSTLTITVVGDIEAV
ncbi:hypothetical protein ABXN37_19825 [Piscinibacter sakaiensis]|uniref:Uncharacterized protein n=1 Tax=Piscinibacter sakaiensis TaxID=1547922 RepID=A0A0K8P487_PISS1|nr:hypothetical protein [Piscinibacter sakaiensis]GAP37374.1 hypothetical protein ISF6_3229 [Piscinibacter sakaiensis]